MKECHVPGMARAEKMKGSLHRLSCNQKMMYSQNHKRLCMKNFTSCSGLNLDGRKC